METEVPKKLRRGDGRRAFFAYRQQIQEQFDQGFSSISVYEPLANVLGISYPQFTRYVNAYIQKPEKLHKTVPFEKEVPLPQAYSFRPTTGFHINRSPRIEDLI